jgi:hypothetical protein
MTGIRPVAGGALTRKAVGIFGTGTTGITAGTRKEGLLVLS